MPVYRCRDLIAILLMLVVLNMVQGHRFQVRDNRGVSRALADHQDHEHNPERPLKSLANLLALRPANARYASSNKMHKGTRNNLRMEASPAVSEKTSFDLKEYMTEKAMFTESILNASLVAKKETALIVESMRYSLMAGGKRVRPMLCFATSEMFGGSADACSPTAVALEMIHTMSLIHDDLPAMDNDSLRRGKPTNHVLYGDDVAILAGDALLSEAFAHVSRETKGVPAERVVRVLNILGECVGAEGLAGGQVMDIKSEGKPAEEVGLDTLTWIHKHKTAALLKAACASGAVLAGASDEDIVRVEEFAEKIGLAFQVADDILDVEATSEELGKTAGKDEAVDKATYPRLLGLEKSKELAREYVEDGKKALSPFGERAVALNALADYIIQRKN